MESNYALYIKEREGKEIIEDSKGFATFTINEDNCYIVDIFVKEEYRQENIASKYADEITMIAKENGCKYLTGSVCPKAHGSDTSLKVLLAYGFKLESSVNNFIYFRKEI